jgi:hypothetical protein
MVAFLAAPPFMRSGTAGLTPADVFNTSLWTGTGAARSITTGVDLATYGGMVLIKDRVFARDYRFFDTTRGATKGLASNTTGAEITRADSLTSFNTNGFSLGADSTDGCVNSATNTDTYVGWTFRKALNFSDEVTYTGNGTAQSIAHSLGATPGKIIIKRRDTAGSNGVVWHRGLASGDYIVLNGTGTRIASTAEFSTDPTASVFSIGSAASVNAAGGTYVAYIFGHDTSASGLIQCGAATGGTAVTLGWQPQFLMLKRKGSSQAWFIIDAARGFASGADAYLSPNSSALEGSGSVADASSTGFTLNSATFGTTANDIIYTAIKA